MENELIDQLVDWVRNRYFGKYRGRVIDNKDGTGRGRIKVSVPAVLEGVYVWAMPCVPYAGKEVGTYIMPELGSGVWIEFEGGDPSYPIWTGAFWTDDELPPNERNKAAVPSLKIIRSKKGLMISFDDNEEVITLSDKNARNIVTIEVKGGKIKVKGALKVVVEAPQIELVENARHPVVFGDELLNYLNQLVTLLQTHVHPGQTTPTGTPIIPTPPAPPFPPATPQLISTKVKSG